MPDQQTLQGVVSNLKYIEQTGHNVRYTDKPASATLVTFDVGGHLVTAANSNFPPLNEGDEVEVEGVVNPRGGMEVVQLRNRTSGATWQFSRGRTALGSLFR
jgi:hypothetical protein